MMDPETLTKLTRTIGAGVYIFVFFWTIGRCIRWIDKQPECCRETLLAILTVTIVAVIMVTAYLTRDFIQWTGEAPSA